MQNIISSLQASIGYEVMVGEKIGLGILIDVDPKIQQEYPKIRAFTAIGTVDFHSVHGVNGTFESKAKSGEGLLSSLQAAIGQEVIVKETSMGILTAINPDTQRGIMVYTTIGTIIIYDSHYTSNETGGIKNGSAQRYHGEDWNQCHCR